MCVRTAAELEGLREAGRIARLCLEAMRAEVREGVTTAALDAIGAAVLARCGARSAPALVYGFPGHSCISVNDEVVHGIPSARVLRAGDLVKLDVTVEKQGFIADTAVTVPVGRIGRIEQELLACTRRAFDAALQVARAGRTTREIGRAIGAEAARGGFAVVRDLSGHGIGRTIHEPPTIPNFDDPDARERLEPGLVITVEPIFALGGGEVALAPDGWTVRTADRVASSHHEHTLVVTESDPLLLTAAA